MVTNGYGPGEAWLNDLDDNVRKIAERDRRGQPYNSNKIRCMLETEMAFDSWTAVCIVETIEEKVKELEG